MYVPSHFEETRASEISRIIEAFPLATLVAQTQDGLIANHIPLMQEVLPDGGVRLIGHIARNNPLHEDALSDVEGMAIFRAGDGYISPNWYPSKADHHKHVPTYNYQAVHCYGHLRMIDDPKVLRGIVGKLTKRFETETNGKQAWRMSDAPRDFMAQMIDAIIGIEIDVSRVVAKSKLSQNREAGDFDSVIAHLEQAGSLELATAMGNAPKP